MRESFLRFTNWAKSTELALFSTVPQLAIRYGIRLIFWGENPGLQLGDLKTLGKTGYDGNNLRNMNTLSGGSMNWMHQTGLSFGELLPYRIQTLLNLRIIIYKLFTLDGFLEIGLLSITECTPAPMA